MNKDIIYRQAAIDAADRADYTGLAVEDVKKVTDEVVKELRQLPSAQPERKKGCKIVKGTGHYGYCACDQCGKPVHPEDKFCSKCGADFREEDT